MRASLLCLVLLAFSLQAAPEDAVVRITSHGCSGTVVYTTLGRTIILTCGHAFERDTDRRKSIIIDAPYPTIGSTRTGGIRLMRLDLKNDLALVDIRSGPFPYVCHVSGILPSPNSWCKSVGYDEMRSRAINEWHRVLVTRGNETLTDQRPWHGRSGGALINQQGRLVGVVSGYENNGARRGIYVSQTTIWRFMGWSATQLKAPPKATESRTPR